jgi:hypothetical protein
METPAVYDLQTEKFANPTGESFTIGRDAAISVPIGRPWGNRGGAGNIAALLDGVEDEHVRVEVRSDAEGARVVPRAETAAIYVQERPVSSSGCRVESGETIVLGTGKADLWEGYRLQVFV